MSPSKLLLATAVWMIPTGVLAAGIPLVDAGGASHGSASLNLARGSVALKVTSLAPLPADVSTGSETFTAHVYKAYLSSSADPAVEICLGDVFPNGKQRAVRKVALKGDLSRMGFDRIAITAFSKDGLKSFDVLTAGFAP